jgi:hypothetical protein
VRVFVVSVLASYTAAVIVNAMRIVIAMWLAVHPIAPSQVTAGAIHRMEGIAVYFCGLMLLYVLARRLDRETTIEPVWWTLCPLVWYYIVTLAIPMANGSGGSQAFAAHAAMVIVLPLILAALVSAVLRGTTSVQPDEPPMVDFPSP